MICAVPLAMRHAVNSARAEADPKAEKWVEFGKYELFKYFFILFNYIFRWAVNCGTDVSKEFTRLQTIHFIIFSWLSVTGKLIIIRKYVLNKVYFSKFCNLNRR